MQYTSGMKQSFDNDRGLRVLIGSWQWSIHCPLLFKIFKILFNIQFSFFRPINFDRATLISGKKCITIFVTIFRWFSWNLSRKSRRLWQIRKVWTVSQNVMPRLSPLLQWRNHATLAPCYFGFTLVYWAAGSHRVVTGAGQVSWLILLCCLP